MSSVPRVRVVRFMAVVLLVVVNVSDLVVWVKSNVASLVKFATWEGTPRTSCLPFVLRRSSPRSAKSVQTMRALGSVAQALRAVWRLES